MDRFSSYKSPNLLPYNKSVSRSGLFYAALMLTNIAVTTAFAQSAPLMPLSPTYAECSTFARDYYAYYKEAERRYMECWAKENHTTTGGGVVVAKRKDPDTECWNPHGPRCGTMARQACDVMLRRDQDIAQCRIYAEKNAKLMRDQLQALVSPSDPSEVEETADDIIDAPGRINQAVDAAGYARDVYNHVTRPQQTQGFPRPPLTPEGAYADAMTDTAINAVRGGTREGMSNFERLLEVYGSQTTSYGGGQSGGTVHTRVGGRKSPTECISEKASCNTACFKEENGPMAVATCQRELCAELQRACMSANGW